MECAIGKRIKSARKRAEITQAELGKRCAVSWQCIAQWETGKRSPKIQTLSRIADALSISIEELTGGLTARTDILFYGRPAIEFLDMVSEILSDRKQVLIVPSEEGYEVYKIDQKIVTAKST